MYYRTESVTPLNGKFIPFVQTLTDEEKTIFIDLINDVLVTDATHYDVSIDENRLISISLWESKEQYLASSTETDELIRKFLDGKCSSDYYNDTSKFTIEVKEEIL